MPPGPGSSVCQCHYPPSVACPLPSLWLWLPPWAPHISVPGLPALPLPPLPISMLPGTRRHLHRLVPAPACFLPAAGHAIISSPAAARPNTHCGTVFWNTAATLLQHWAPLAKPWYAGATACATCTWGPAFSHHYLEQRFPGADQNTGAGPQSSGPVVLGNCVPRLCGVGVGWRTPGLPDPDSYQVPYTAAILFSILLLGILQGPPFLSSHPLFS